MAECTFLAGCPFFNDQLPNMGAFNDLIKDQLCRGDHSNCARKLVAESLGRENVPSDLYPSMTEYAENIIAEAAKMVV